jgi:DNA polymerase III delta prime subunit
MNISYLKKYQPTFYKDFFIDEEYITLLNTLQKMNNLNILFIGDSGVGKTSFIHATIREYYNLEKIPKNNVLFINSLKEQGIHYYRNNLKTFCQTTSSIPLKKKFIVLDDIDFINEQSQQVFRNCMDKYSHNVHFLISCQNNQKVIDNIQSRSIIIKLNKINEKRFNDYFKNIKKKENIKITKQAEKFLLTICKFSISKLLNCLEKFKLYNKNVDLECAKKICTNISFLDFEKYTNYWIEKDYINSIEVIMNIYKKGYSVLDILDNYFCFIKITNILEEEIKYKTIKYICKYIETFYCLHENEIELAFFTNNLIKNLT